MTAKVGILMGSDSDLPVMKDAAEVLDEFQIPYELTVISAHRNPEKLFRYAGSAEERGLKVIIAGAGGAAHLPGVIAAHTVLPVIGVPIKTSTLNGLDSLFSIVQMPGGVPVATVGINGAKNAGLLAVQMLGLADEALQERFTEYKKAMAERIDDVGAEVERLGYQEYLKKRGS
ncbi:MAG: 5-(carboxyamino)imidazole ribonucleotide mutase [Halanaerobiaceae bacterium]|nr:5-(carboxyamino)imidazole ribonucleotide mutase [Halanaerobiaceae bacterium]